MKGRLTQRIAAVERRVKALQQRVDREADRGELKHILLEVSAVLDDLRTLDGEADQSRRVLLQINKALHAEQVQREQDNLLLRIEQDRESLRELAGMLEKQRYTLQAIMENTPAQLAYLDPDFNFVQVNSAYCEGSGYSKGELIGRNHFDLFPDEENRAIFEQVRDTGETVMFHAKPFAHPNREGTSYWDWTLAPVKSESGDVWGLVFSLVDVTAQERAQRALRRYADRLQVLHQVDQAILSARSMDETAESALREVPRLLPECVYASVLLYDRETEEVSLLAVHADQETRLEKGWRDVMDETWADDLDRLAEGRPYVIPDVRAIPKPSTLIEALRSEGVRAYVLIPLIVDQALVGSFNLGMGEPGALKPGQMEMATQLAVQLAIGIQRTRLDEQLTQYAEHLEEMIIRRTRVLRSSEARWRAIFENAALGIAIIDLEGRLVQPNPALQEMLGYDADELRGVHFADLTHPQDVDKDLGLFREMVAGARESYAIEKRYVRQDNEVLYARLNASLISGDLQASAFVVGLVEDVTERKRTQEALVQSEKLALTGRLAASLAHEINNPMQSVIGCLGLAEESLVDGDSDAVRDLLQIATEELERAAGIVSQLRNLQRPSRPEERKPVDINQLVERVLVLSKKKCQKLHVDVVWNPADELPQPLVAADRMHQVFLNLVLNAVEAMPDGGRLEIDTVRCDDPPGVQITFADSGRGISSEELSQLFAPFYTTKADGIGLGLYVSQNIVAEHGGWIEVESQTGQGTTFTVWLPA